MLADLIPADGADEWLILHWGGLRALNLFVNCGRVEQARQVLADVKDRVDSGAAVGLVAALEVSFRFFSGDVATTIETGPSFSYTWSTNALIWLSGCAPMKPSSGRPSRKA